MADDVASALQKGLVARLRSVSAISAAVGARVFDEPPEGCAFPYLRVGEIFVNDNSTDSTRDFLLRVGIEVYSRPAGGVGRGKPEAQRILGLVASALDRGEASVSVTGFALSHLGLITTGPVVMVSDGKTYEGTAVFEARLAAGNF